MRRIGASVLFIGFVIRFRRRGERKRNKSFRMTSAMSPLVNGIRLLLNISNLMGGDGRRWLLVQDCQFLLFVEIAIHRRRNQTPTVAMNKSNWQSLTEVS